MAVVKVYSTPTCPWCVRAKQYLSSKNIAYTDINVAVDRNAAMEMVKKSGQQGVPVIEIDGNIIVGFDQARIDSLLGLS
ncbi:MAG: glutaredoxin family protein [bacterium]|nr:glutaredoxin family protein [bacterium]